MDNDDPSSPAARQATEARNLARHVNERYPDTVLFLAHHAAGRTDAIGAQVEGVVGGALVLGVMLGASSATERVSLQLPEADGGDGLRPRLIALVRQTRSSVSASVPLTSLESMILGESSGGHAHNPKHGRV